MLLTAGFFASKTIGLDFYPLQAMNNYGIRDQPEKCFALQKGPLGHDRLGPGPREEQEAARLSRKWKYKSFRYTKLANAEYLFTFTTLT